MNLWLFVFYQKEFFVFFLKNCSFIIKILILRVILVFSYYTKQVGGQFKMDN